MVIGLYILIITLNENGLNAPSKRHRLAECIKKNKMSIYAVYKRPASHVGTHKNWKRESRKRYSMQMWIKQKQE